VSILVSESNTSVIGNDSPKKNVCVIFTGYISQALTKNDFMILKHLTTFYKHKNQQKVISDSKQYILKFLTISRCQNPVMIFQI